MRGQRKWPEKKLFKCLMGLIGEGVKGVDVRVWGIEDGQRGVGGGCGGKWIESIEDGMEWDCSLRSKL